MFWSIFYPTKIKKNKLFCIFDSYYFSDKYYIPNEWLHRYICKEDMTRMQRGVNISHSGGCKRERDDMTQI